jgi:hypothetical protein
MNLTRVLVGFLVVIAALALIAHLSTTDLEYSRYNWEWTGTSGFFALLEQHDARDITSYTALEGRNDTLFLIISPDAAFTPAEMTSLSSFLDNRNTVFIADETGAANDLLGSLGSSISIIPGNLSSVDVEYSDPRSVMAYPKGEDPVIANISTVVLNRPAAVSGGDILLSTTIFSWIDVNGDGRIDAGEQLSSYGVLSREPIGNGTLYVLSDPSIVANGMLQARLSGENSLFIDHILTLRPIVFIDQSHSRTAGADEVLILANFVKSSMIFKISLLILTIIIVALGFYRRWGEEHGTNDH